jgi:hypothetical protein
MKFLFLLSFAWILMLLPVKGQNLFDAAHSKQFASFLFNTRQFNQAAIEYERILLYTPDDSVKFELLRSYRLSGQKAFALQRLNALYPASSPMSLPIQIEAQKILSENDQGILSGEYAFSESEFLGMSLAFEAFHRQKWKGKSNAIYNQPENTQNATALAFYQQLNQFSQERWKNPWIAGGLSAILPGAGRVYAGDWKNALVSVMFVGINSYQSIRGFRKNGIQSSSGWIFGTIAAGFYIGNIYGSAWTAKRKNQQKYDRYKKTIGDMYYGYMP